MSFTEKAFGLFVSRVSVLQRRHSNPFDFQGLALWREEHCVLVSFPSVFYNFLQYIPVMLQIFV